MVEQLQAVEKRLVGRELIAGVGSSAGIAVSIDAQWIRYETVSAGDDFLAVVETIAVGVRIVRIGIFEHFFKVWQTVVVEIFTAVRNTVVIRVGAQRIGTDIDLGTIRQAVAVAVGVEHVDDAVAISIRGWIEFFAVEQSVAIGISE